MSLCKCLVLIGTDYAIMTLLGSIAAQIPLLSLVILIPNSGYRGIAEKRDDWEQSSQSYQHCFHPQNQQRRLQTAGSAESVCLWFLPGVGEVTYPF